MLMRQAVENVAQRQAQTQRAQPLEAEWQACAASCERFIDSHIQIDEPQGASFAVIPFKLWDSQREALAQFLIHRLLIVLKARQLGITWLACAYVLWLCLFQAGRVCLLFSKGQDEANELLRRVKAMYRRLPEWMQAREPLIVSNTSELEWTNGSRVKSLAATESAGRSFTASFVLMDEAAHMRWGDTVYTALKPTIDAGGKLFIISTANGLDALFYPLWQNAVKRLNDYLALFLSWRARPSRDDTWRAKVASEALSSALDLQEYPDNADEAFQATGNERFLPSMLMWQSCQESLPPLNAQEPMVLAADAGVSNDCFALVGVTRHPQRKSDVAVRLVRVWKPRGQPLDFDMIEREIVAILQDKARYNVVQFTYDKYQLHQMAGHLKGLVWCREFSQQAERLTADKQLLDLIQSRRLAHDGNADLTAHIDNADRKPDPNSQQLRIVKRREDLKIDLAVGLSMATAECLRLNL